MRGTLRALVLLSVLGAAGAAHADVTVPASNPAFQTPPTDAPPPSPAPSLGGGTMATKPVVGGLVAILFLVMGAVAANDKKKKAGPASARPSSRRA